MDFNDKLLLTLEQFNEFYPHGLTECSLAEKGLIEDVLDESVTWKQFILRVQTFKYHVSFSFT